MYFLIFCVWQVKLFYPIFWTLHFPYGCICIYVISVTHFIVAIHLWLYTVQFGWGLFFYFIIIIVCLLYSSSTFFLFLIIFIYKCSTNYMFSHLFFCLPILPFFSPCSYSLTYRSLLQFPLFKSAYEYFVSLLYFLINKSVRFVFISLIHLGMMI